MAQVYNTGFQANIWSLITHDNPEDSYQQSGVDIMNETIELSFCYKLQILNILKHIS